MITAKKISATQKQEVLNAIENTNFYSEDFYQEFEGDLNSSSTCKKTIESDHFNIVIELIENVRWTSFRDFDFDSLEINDFIVIDENGDEYHSEFTDNEILNAINY